VTQPLFIERVRKEGFQNKMNSAGGVLLSLQDYVQSEPAPNRTQETIFNLVHDLRQPLSAIEAIAYYLEMTLPSEQLDARRQLAQLRELVGQSGEILSDAVKVARRG
jgi:signal transduction histidine kinase